MNTIDKAVIVAFTFILGMVIFPLFYLLNTGDFPGAQVFYGLQEDHEIVGMLFTVREWFTGK